VANNLTVWTNEFVLRPLYKLRRWWFLHQGQTIPLQTGVSTYSLLGSASALYITAAASGTLPLLLPPLVQAQQFWQGSGPPDAIALLPSFGSSPTSSPVTEFQIFPTPDASTYTIAVDFTQAFPPLLVGTDHNFLTDEFPMLVQAGMMAMSHLALHEEPLFTQWFRVYAQQVRSLASYDHEVRRGGTMPEPMEPFVPEYGMLAQTQGAGQSASQAAAPAAAG
jgi:hypothetical protein